MRIIGVFAYYSIMLILSALAVSAQVVAPVLVEEIKPTLASYMMGLDWVSLLVAALIALTGGAGRTAASLFKEGQSIRNAFRETVKDAMVAMVTGALCFILINAYASIFSPPPLALQAGFIFVAGFARGKFIDWLDIAFGKALDLGFDVASTWVRNKVESTKRTEDQPKEPAP